MTTRTLRFFMTMEETCAIFRALAVKYKLKMYVYPLVKGKAQEWDFSDLWSDALGVPFFIYIDPHADRERPITAEYLYEAPKGKTGVVSLLVDGVENNRLYLSDMRARSDWFDDGKICENPEPLRLHRRLRTEVLKYVQGGMVVKNVKLDTLGGRGSVVNDVYYSPGAERFYSAGGELMQRGVENQRFAPMPRVDPKAKP
jgi:hypothetical protein